MSKKTDKAKTPIRMTKAILDMGANLTNDIIINGYGFPITVTIRPLTDDEFEAINAKTIKPMDAMAVLKAVGKTIKDAQDMTPDQWEAVISQAVEDGKIDPESFKAQTARYIEMIRLAVLDEPIRTEPEKLRFGSISALGRAIERITMVAPQEIEDFLSPSTGNAPQCSSSQDIDSQIPSQS